LCPSIKSTVFVAPATPRLPTEMKPPKRHGRGQAVWSLEGCGWDGQSQEWGSRHCIRFSGTGRSGSDVETRCLGDVSACTALPEARPETEGVIHKLSPARWGL
jgi:hypothetical protein